MTLTAHPFQNPISNAINGKLENVDSLWQEGPQTWQGGPAGQEKYSSLAARILYLMGNKDEFKLVISIIGPESQQRKDGGSYSNNNDKLTSFLKQLKKAGIKPKLVYHPDLQQASSDWGSDELKGTTDDMAAFNAYIKKAGNDLPIFEEYLLEGADAGKNPKTIATLRNLINAPDSGLDPNTQIWFTGDWAEGLTLDNPPPYSPDRSVQDNGVYMQLYDFNKYGYSLSNKPTNPDQATQLGKDFIDDLTGTNHPYNSNVFNYPERAYQTFTFDNSTDITHAPGFEGSTLTTAPWDASNFNLFTESFIQAFEAVPEFNSGAGAPPLAIWYAENAVGSLSPNPSTHLAAMFGDLASSVQEVLNL